MRLALMLAVLLFAMPAQACLWVGGMRQSLFTALPAKAEARSINAKVRIISTRVDPDTRERVSQTSVIDAIKGVRRGEAIRIITGTSDCDSDYDVTAGQTYFIAGERGASGQFNGVWSGLGEYIAPPAR